MHYVSCNNLLWWDRDTDYSGRPIREDVRVAARQVWQEACRQTQASFGDACEAAGMMERTVTQVSRYLDRRQMPIFAQDAAGLVLCAFCRALRRCITRHQRMELIDNPEEFSVPEAWMHCASKADCGLDAQKAASQLTKRGRNMYELRRAGFSWKEVAQVLKTSAAAARTEYCRELKRVQLKMQNQQKSRLLRAQPGGGHKYE